MNNNRLGKGVRGRNRFIAIGWPSFPQGCYAGLKLSEFAPGSFDLAGKFGVLGKLFGIRCLGSLGSGHGRACRRTAGLDIPVTLLHSGEALSGIYQLLFCAGELLVLLLDFGALSLDLFEAFSPLFELLLQVGKCVALPAQLGTLRFDCGEVLRFGREFCPACGEVPLTCGEFIIAGCECSIAQRQFSFVSGEFLLNTLQRAFSRCSVLLQRHEQRLKVFDSRFIALMPGVELRTGGTECGVPGLLFADAFLVIDNLLTKGIKQSLVLLAIIPHLSEAVSCFRLLGAKSFKLLSSLRNGGVEALDFGGFFVVLSVEALERGALAFVLAGKCADGLKPVTVGRFRLLQGVLGGGQFFLFFPQGLNTCEMQGTLFFCSLLPVAQFFLCCIHFSLEASFFGFQSDHRFSECLVGRRGSWKRAWLSRRGGR